MDAITLWTAVTAVAAVIAAVGAIGALLATTLQLQRDRLARETDYYRKLTPFLSFEVPDDLSSGAPPAVDIYADGGGYAFNVLVDFEQINSTTGQNRRLPGQEPVRYLREGPPKRVNFGSRLGPGFLGYLNLTFKDTFGIQHSARQAANMAGGELATTDSMEWLCDDVCRVHVIRPAPAPGFLPTLAQHLRLY